MDMMEMYDLDMAYRRKRLRNTVREDVAWDILVEAGGATHTIRVQCHAGQSAIIDWGDNNATEATATTLTNYEHAYAAGTYAIRITGGAYQVMAYASEIDARRTRTVRNINCTGMISINNGFSGPFFLSNLTIAEGCRLASSITNMQFAFRNCIGALTSIPDSFVLPAGITDAFQAFNVCSKLVHVPLSFWPKGGFTYSGAINLASIFRYCPITNSIAPSQILWDSGKTFTVDRDVFGNNPSSFLNYSSAYTDPVSGITYTKIPYAWGGAPD